MPQTKEEKDAARKFYGERVYESAPMVACGCGCGTMIKSKDKHCRTMKYARDHHPRKYEDPTQYKREWNHRNRESRYQFKKNYSRKRKIELIYLKGGQCCDCGVKYDGANASIFDFHHRDPSTKERSLGVAVLQNIAKEKILEELEKCDLMCSNCHRLFHTGGW